MFSFTNNGTFETPSGWGDDQQRPGHYNLMPQQQSAPAIGSSSCSDLHGTGESRQESYMVAGFPPNTNSWSNNTFPDPSFSVYAGGAWPGDQHLDETRLGSLFSVPGSSAARSEVFTEMQVATPLVEQASPVAQRALPTFQPCPPPSLTWTQAPGPPWQSSSPWYRPVHAARQHSGHSSPIGSLGMRPEIPPFQLATSSVITGHSERSFCQTGRPHPIATSNSVQFSSRNDPVAVSPSTPQLRGERWDLPNAITFQCLWSSRGTQCPALIAGVRRSVTSHLRDEHDFSCDGRTIACAWAGCTTWMQRRNIPRHIVACHLAIKVTCSGCGLALSRADANKKHRLACTGVQAPAVEATEEDEGGYF